MSYNLYDFNNAIQQRNEYVEDRLRDGSPVVGVSYEGGVLLLTVRQSQRKVFEIYDRMMMSGLGSQSDIEDIRQAAIDIAHKEGFERSPDDVTVQRLVGFGLSRGLKNIYNDQRRIPLTFRGIFAEMGKTPADDQFFVLGYDGEFRIYRGHAIAAGTEYAEEQAAMTITQGEPATLDVALKVALHAWGVAKTQLSVPPEQIDEDFEEDRPVEETDPTAALQAARKEGAVVEVGILERHTAKEIKFRLLTESEIPVV